MEATKKFTTFPISFDNRLSYLNFAYKIYNTKTERKKKLLYRKRIYHNHDIEWHLLGVSWLMAHNNEQPFFFFYKKQSKWLKSIFREKQRALA